MPKSIEALKKELEQLEQEYQQAQNRPSPDRRQVDHLYKKLKKARKELSELESE